MDLNFAAQHGPFVLAFFSTENVTQGHNC